MVKPSGRSLCAANWALVGVGIAIGATLAVLSTEDVNGAMIGVGWFTSPYLVVIGFGCLHRWTAGLGAATMMMILFAGVASLTASHPLAIAALPAWQLALGFPLGFLIGWFAEWRLR
ncbi:MAG: hypothetical protein AAF493_18060 [Pseudomonadota bacterium]